MANLKVWGAENCQPCRMTKLSLDKLGIAYDYVIAGDEDRDKLAAMGFRSFPVVQVKLTGDSWCGFNPDKIKELTQ